MLSDAQLLEKRQHGDPLADQVVDDIIKQGNGKQVAELFNTLTENVDVPKHLLPSAAVDYFEKTKELPAYYDQKLIEEAQQIFSDFGPEISMILLCKSLPQCYACGKGAKVLYHTGRFVEHDGNYELLTRRLMETAQFVINVMNPGSFEPDGKAVITTQKVRLIHASIRYFIRQSGRWDYQVYGVPINQEDMAGTLMSFSALVLQGLGQMGIELKEGQKEAFFHLWRVIGHINGVDADLIPESAADGMRLGQSIFKQQLLPTKEGKELTYSAIGFMKNVTPGTLFDWVPEALVYHFLGEEVAKTVGVEKPSRLEGQLSGLLLHLFDKYEEVEDVIPGLNKIAGKFNRLFLQGMLYYFNDMKKVTFDIPPGLKSDWNLN